MAASPVHDLFVSYAAPDRAWVEGYLLDALSAAGVRAHTEEAFALGRPRLLEFEAAVRDSRRILLVISAAYLADDASGFVDLLAHTYGLEAGTWPVIPLRLEPVELPRRLRMLGGLDATDAAAQERAVARLLADLNRPVAPTAPPPCPYPGMRAFTAAQAALFHGRDREIADLVGRLRGQRDRANRFLAVIGPSGSGKSSLVFAGLVPALGAGTLVGDGPWQVLSLRPGAAPLETPVTVVGADPPEVGPPVTELRAGPPDGQRLLVVDQFEELFTQSAPEQAAAFQAVLAELAAAPNSFVVVTARADFYEDLMAAPLWPLIAPSRVEVLPLGEDGLREAIVKPAAWVGVHVEAALVERLVADAAGEPGVLPLVQETLVLLWEKLERRYLPLRAYEALVLPRGADGGPPAGRTGLEVAVARHADATIAELTDAQQAIARRVFLGLIQPNAGRADTRRQRTVAGLRSATDDPATFDAVIEHLAANRLLTLSGGEHGAARRVDLAHEALIGGWPWLRELLATYREATQTKDRLDATVADWVRLGRGRGGLLDAVELAEAEAWLASPEATVLGSGADLPALVDASRSELDRETQRLRRRLYGAVAFGAVALLAAAIALVFFQRAETESIKARDNLALAEQNAALAETRAVEADNSAGTAEAERLNAVAAASTAEAEANARATAQIEAQENAADAATAEARAETNAERAEAEAATAEAERERAEHEYRVALSRQLAAQSLDLTDEHPDVAALLSVEANDAAVTSEARASLLASISNPHLTRYLWGHSGEVTSVAFSPDGTMLATGGMDGFVILWDVASGEKLTPILESGEAGVSSVTFSPDGRILASGHGDGTVTLWNVATGQPQGDPLSAHDGIVWSVTFSPDGSTIATSGTDGQVVLWDAAGRERRREPLLGHAGWVIDVAFSPDGTLLASSGDDAKVIIWDAATGERRFTLDHQGWIVWSVEFSPNGRLLATGAANNAVSFWDPQTGQPTGEQLEGHRDTVLDVSFSPDGATLASGGADDRVIFWDVDTRQMRGQPLAGHAAEVFGVAYSPDGSSVASAGGDGATILWTPTDRQALGTTLADAEGVVLGVALSPDGTKVAFPRENDIVLIDASTGEQLGQPLLGHEAAVSSVTFSPDGSLLASSSGDGTVILWDVATGHAKGEPLTGFDGIVWSVAFSHDGEILAAGGCGKTGSHVSVCEEGLVQIWTVSTGRPLSNPLVGHDSFVYSVAFSPGSTRLASGGADGAIIVWDVATGQPRDDPIRTDAGIVWSVAFSSDGATLASGNSDGSVHLWDVATGDSRGEPLGGFQAPVSSVAYSADGEKLVTGSWDGSVVLWTLEDGAPLRLPLGNHDDQVQEVSISLSGDKVVSTGSDGSVIMWLASEDAWKARACDLAGRNLTPGEWQRYLGPNVPYKQSCPTMASSDSAPVSSSPVPMASPILIENGEQAPPSPPGTSTERDDAVVATGAPGATGLISDGHYVSPQHGLEVRWDRPWFLDPNDQAAVTSVGTSDELWLTWEKDRTFFWLAIDGSKGSSPHDVIADQTSDEFLESLAAADPDVRAEVLLTGSAGGASAAVIRVHQGDRERIVLVEAVEVAGGQSIATATLVGDPNTFLEAHHDITRHVSLDGQSPYRVFTTDQMREVISPVPGATPTAADATSLQGATAAATATGGEVIEGDLASRMGGAFSANPSATPTGRDDP